MHLILFGAHSHDQFLMSHCLRKDFCNKNPIGDHSSLDVQFEVECDSEEDRRFLYSRMTDWFGSPVAFEQYVRVVIREELSEQLSSSQVGFESFESFEGFAMST